MSKRFHIICLSVGLATASAGMGTADSPAGNVPSTQSAEITESVEASAPSVTVTEPESPEHGETRAQRLAEIESTDPTAWLMRFGSVAKRPLLHAEP